MLYPLKFQPHLLPKIWGGKVISQWYRPASDKLDNVGESWIVSAFPAYPSVVCNGSLADNELPELLEVYMGELVGDSVYEAFGNTFPLLIKFIDAADDLSVQVHPDDAFAAENENSLGKTEMWYVMDSDPKASVVLGWNKEETEDTVRQAIANGTLMEALKHYNVRKGNVVMINSGSVHALKKGTIVAEIQENSDITYRLYDYDRVDKQGQKRPLHIEKSLQVLNYAATEGAVTSPAPKINGVVNLEQTPYFTTNLLQINRTIQRDYTLLDSFVVYICTEGAIRVEALDEDVADDERIVSLRKGEAVLLPAALDDIRITPEGEAELLEVYVDMKLSE